MSLLLSSIVSRPWVGTVLTLLILLTLRVSVSTILLLIVVMRCNTIGCRAGAAARLMLLLVGMSVVALVLRHSSISTLICMTGNGSLDGTSSSRRLDASAERLDLLHQ